MDQEIASQIVGLGGNTDFSLLSLFLRADFVVKFVIILLIACSIFSWALIFDKLKLFKNINRSIEDFEKLDEVIVVGGRKKEETVNEFSSVSARSLNIEDANLYAASFGDPARQVQNFAGVTGNGDDLNNEIVIRGNSPNTVLWRLEGAEIPNPNHFVYSTGGAVSMLSSNVLDKTDFFTSAFPAEYGNGLAGVFDLRFRKGNNKKR